MVPRRHDMLIHDRFDTGEVGDHAEFRILIDGNDVTADGYLDCIAMPVQMPALTVVIRDSMTGVEFEPAGDAHEGFKAAAERASISPRSGQAVRPRC